MSLELELEPESGQHDIAQVLVVRRNQGLGLLWPGSGGVLLLADCEIICPLGRWLDTSGWIFFLVYCYFSFCNAFSVS